MWPLRKAARSERKEPILNSSPENPSTNLSDPSTWLYESLGGGSSISGPVVSDLTAMRLTTVFACVSIKAGIVASLPLMVYRRTPHGRELAPEHRLYQLLHDDPNELMSSFVWIELITANLMMQGNHYSLIETDNAWRVTGLLPLVPQQVTPRRVNGRNRYRVQLSDGIEDVDQDEMLHVPGPGFDGIRGLSRIASVGRDAIGIGLAMQEQIGRIHSNGMRPSGVVEAAQGLKPEGLKRLKQEFADAYSGLSNSGKTLFLDAGMKWSAMQLSPEDAQTLENRRYQVADVCRIFGVPPFLVGETDKTTSWGTGIEQQTLGFLKFHLNPDLCRIEGELNRKLFKAPYYCEFNREALNAMDAKTQAELYASGIQNGVYMPNEVRRLRNLPDAEGGDRLFINSTMVPIDKAGNTAPTSAGDPNAPTQ